MRWEISSTEGAGWNERPDFFSLLLFNTHFMVFDRVYKAGIQHTPDLTSHLDTPVQNALAFPTRRVFNTP